MKRNKQRLFEVMHKVNPDFKPKLNEVSQELADRALQKSFSNIAKTYSAQPHDAEAHQKALRQTNTFRNYKSPENKENPEQQKVSEEKIVNPKYTHFALLKDTNEIVNGWDYNGVEPVELRQFKKDYFFNDLADMGIDPHNIKVVTTKYLQTSGINPFDPANWKQDANATTLQEGRQGFKRLTVFRIYDKNGSYLGDLDPIDEEERESEFYEGTKTEVFKTPEFQKLAQAKNITPEQVGRVVKDSEYTMDGNPLEMEHYSPSDSMELYDPIHRVFYNRSGQQLRNPREYDRSDPEWTPFGDEGEDY